MPITKLQTGVLAVIAKHRDPESFVAGGVPINRAGPRYSSDIDIFNDRMERVGQAAEADAAALAASGFEVTWQRQLPSIVSAEIRKGNESTKLEWVADSDFRFFPATPDPQFGYVLSLPDLAINKLIAAVGRREPRDVIDLLTIHESGLPIGAVAWAATEVAPGFTPEGLIAELRRNARYIEADFRKLALDRPVTAAAVAKQLSAALAEAEIFVEAMPSDKSGRLFLQNGIPVQPDPSNLAAYTEHKPQRRGHWPSTTEIGSAMLERYVPRKPKTDQD